jgi:hypothetical protein
MIDPKTIRTLTEFQRSAKAALQRLRKSGQPEVLTVNGKAALIVQDAEAYFRNLEELERGYEIEAVQAGIEQMKAGMGRPFGAFDREFRAERARKRKTRRKSA